MGVPQERRTRRELQISRPNARVAWVAPTEEGIKKGPQRWVCVLPISCHLSCLSPKHSSLPFPSPPKDFSSAYPKSSCVPGSLVNSMPGTSQQNNGWMAPYCMASRLAHSQSSPGHTLRLSGRVMLEASWGALTVGQSCKCRHKLRAEPGLCRLPRAESWL